MGIEPDKLRGVYADLARIIGTERFLALCETFGGTNLYVPKIDRVLQEIRNEEIRREFEGQNYKLLAAKYGLSERRVRQIVDGARRQREEKK